MTTPNTPAAQTPPTTVPEKFLKDGQPDVSALVQAYTELEKKLGSQAPAAQATPAVTETPKATEQQAASQAEPQDFLTKYQQEYVEKGGLSDESYKELAGKGISKATADQFIQFQQTEAEKYATAITGVVGGVDSYTQMATWAHQNFTAAEQQAYDTAIRSGDLNAAKLAVSGLKTRYEQANGKDPSLLGGSTGVKGIQPFANLNDAAQFRSNPKYRTDPDYRRTYIERLAVSKI